MSRGHSACKFGCHRREGITGSKEGAGFDISSCQLVQLHLRSLHLPGQLLLGRCICLANCFPGLYICPPCCTPIFFLGLCPTGMHMNLSRYKLERKVDRISKIFQIMIWKRAVVDMECNARLWPTEIHTFMPIYRRFLSPFNVTV